MANFVGDISKTLFGTLSEADLEQINSKFDKIYTDNKKVASVLTNHTKILKLILDSSSVNHKELLNNRINKRKLTTREKKYGYCSDSVLLWGSFTVKLEAGGARLRQSCLLTHIT